MAGMTTPHTTANPAALAAAMGYDPPSASWPGSDRQAVPTALFGKDHWSTFAAVEHWAVDRQGLLDHDRMRCSATLHPTMLAAKPIAALGRIMPSSIGAEHPTIIKDGQPPDEHGRYGDARVAAHDDYSCLDDLLHAGLLTVAMPPCREDGLFTDIGGRPIQVHGETISAAFLTGMAEWELAAYARWNLTGYGRKVHAALRTFKADGGRFQDFVPPPA